jgi:hypothetical protein
VSYYRRLDGYTPPERDTAHWTQWRIEEAVTPSDVDATAIEGPTALSPAITDPMAPPTYNFETRNAALSQGWYRVVWLDAGGAEQSTAWAPLRNLSPYAPTVGDIATILRARTVERGATPVQTFTDQTTPTAQEVQQTIILFAPLVLARLGRLDNLGCANSEDLRAASTAVAAQRVALEVEATYWPEEIGDQAAVDIRRQMLDTDITGLMTGLESCRASSDDGGDGGESDSRFDPAYRFPLCRPLRF